MNKSFIPGILSSANLCLGVISITQGFRNNILASALCIISAAFIHIYGGRLALTVNAVSITGKQLYPLSDFVSFGLAPALLSWNLALSSFGVLGYIPLLLYPVCGAYNIAKSNALRLNETCQGLPVTAAGIIYAVFSLSLLKLHAHAGISAILLILLSYLMICKMKFRRL